jgi:hypothetical protein
MARRTSTARWNGQGLDNVGLTVDIAPAIEAWRDRFVSQVGVAKYRRAAGWAVDETAKAAVLGIRSQFDKHLRRQVPWTKSAVTYARAEKAGLNAIEQGTRTDVYAQVFVKPKQSVYLKYLFGMGDNTRLPGDVGLAQNKILLPWWDNILLTQGVRPTKYGGVPTGFLARLSREVQGTRAPKRSGTQSRWGVYYGEIKLHGQPRMAYIARPPRVPVTDRDLLDGRKGATALDQAIVTKAGEVKRVGRAMRDVDHPRILFLAVDRATYKPVLEQPWREACEAAAARIPSIMAQQLADNIAHRNAKLGFAAAA